MLGVRKVTKRLKAPYALNRVKYFIDLVNVYTQFSVFDKSLKSSVIPAPG